MKLSMHWLAISLLSVATLSGCDSVENAANKAVEDAKESVTQIAKETISESLNEFSKQVDKAQESTDSWLKGKQPDEEQEAADEAERPKQNEA